MTKYVVCFICLAWATSLLLAALDKQSMDICKLTYTEAQCKYKLGY